MLDPCEPSPTTPRRDVMLGRIYPETGCETGGDGASSTMQTQCLIHAASTETPVLDVQVRFLHPIAREVGRLPVPLPAVRNRAQHALQVVPFLRVGSSVHQTWKEVVEREVSAPLLSVRDLVYHPQEVPFHFADSRMLEPIRDEQDRGVGVLRRRQHALDGIITIAAAPVEADLFRLTVRLMNGTPLPEIAAQDPDETLLRSFTSAHMVLSVQEGVFLSLMAPPPAYANAAAACENVGAWPVLIGDAEAQNTMLASPIILYDYPRIFPEQTRKVFDDVELDELLTQYSSAHHRSQCDERGNA